ncbi:hypothetical protein BHE74_00025199 [Ensete ventricosum]|nr:hypothetical protein BHE74_00025199 [Ensete ventricosum]
MAVAMASGSLCLSPTARAGENCLPGLRCCSLRCPPFAVPIASKIRFCLVESIWVSRLYSDAAITVPRAASPTTVEVRNLNLLLCLYVSRIAKFSEMGLCRSTGRKIEDPELLEAIRLTIINNMIEYHPVTMIGAFCCIFLVDVDIATHIDVYDDGPDRSLLVVETADYPGLLVDLVKIITDINITVQSGEFDTEV